MSIHTQRSLRVGFAGTPDFATRCLTAIVAAGFPVPIVASQPERPRGRGLRVEASSVARYAAAYQIPVHSPGALRTDAEVAPLLRVPIDVLVVAAYGLIVPPAVLAWPIHGGLNVHASRLPRWRGAAPIQRAIDAGDPVTGVSIMRMDAGLDTGPVVATVDVPIDPRETAGSLHDKLAEAGADAIVVALDRLERDGRLVSRPQSDAGVTYAGKIGPADAVLDWRRDAAALDRRIRALDPVPGATARLADETVKVWKAFPMDRTMEAPAATVLAAGAQGLEVACGASVDGGRLRITELQPAGGRRMPVAAFLASRRIVPGMRFAVTS